MPIDAPIHTSEANLPRVLAAGLPVVLVFWQRDCAPCDQLRPALDWLARVYAGRALFVLVNAGEEVELAGRYRIGHLPGIVFIKDGQELATAHGAAAESALVAWLDYLTGGQGIRPPLPSGPSVPIQSGSSVHSRTDPRPAHDSGGASAGTPPVEPVVMTDADFERRIQESKVPVLVDFWAAWCGPCKMIAPSVESLAREFAGRVLVAKLNVDENPRTAGRFGVTGIPTLLIFRNGQVVDQIVGVQPLQTLRQRLAQQIP